jgi:hypothetical protein
VAEVLSHQKHDQIIKGTYGVENGKWRGCAVGCSIHSYNLLKDKNINTSNHTAYQTELGIPESLARLEDYLFETMPKDKAMKWPVEFMKAIPVGINLSMVAPKFIAGTLRDLLKMKEVKDDKAVTKAVADTAKLWEMVIAGKNVKQAAWSAASSAAESARSAAESAAWSAVSAAWSAAWSAAESTASSARSAASSAVESAARSAAWSAVSAARSAAESAARSAASLAASLAARSTTAYNMSRRLLKIIRSTK